MTTNNQAPQNIAMHSSAAENLTFIAATGSTATLSTMNLMRRQLLSNTQ